MPKPRARWATSWPMRPKPRTPRTFSLSSTPLKRDRSQAPPTSEECACGTLRARASSIAIVCSAAVITFDCGALATITPCLVAASTSTLSTPTPARPTALRFSALASRSAVSLVPERIRMPSKSPIRRSSSPSSQSTPSSTSKPASRSSWTPESPIFSLTRTFTSGRLRDGHARLEEDALGGRDAGAELELVAEVAQRHLERRDRDHDVEGPEVAAVGDARDLALQLALPAGDRHAVAVAHGLRHRGAVDRLGQLDRGHDVGVLVLGSEQLEVERPGGLARGAAEQPVALVDGVQSLLLDQPQGHVERHHQADGRREGRVRRVLALAGEGLLPVEVVAGAAAPGPGGGRRLVGAREGEARRRHQ